jgi:hypothetical protein
MNKKFKVGDKVMISKASEYYGTTKSNPKDVEGVITGISGEAGSLPYYVQWSNETRNNYEASDLVNVDGYLILEEVKVREKSIHDILVERSTLEVGDVVMVTHKVPDYDLGWECSWREGMDDTIGKECVVTEVPYSSGVRLDDKYRANYYYPLQSVRLVHKGPKPIHVHISDDYIAEVTKKGIKINDQMITFEDFDELAAAVAKMRK